LIDGGSVLSRRQQGTICRDDDNRNYVLLLFVKDLRSGDDGKEFSSKRTTVEFFQEVKIFQEMKISAKGHVIFNTVDALVGLACHTVAGRLL
jgi:hypothetical protein